MNDSNPSVRLRLIKVKSTQYYDFTEEYDI